MRAGSRERPDPALPRRFDGAVYEIVERTVGNERVLARRLSGQLGLPLPAPLGYGRLSTTIERGPPIDEREFLSVAAGAPAKELYALQQRPPIAAWLDEIESYFDGRPKETADRAARLWVTIAKSYTRGHPDVLKARIARMIAGEDVRRLRVGLNALFSLPPADRAFAEPRLLELAFSPLLASLSAPVVRTLRSHLGSAGPAYPPDVRERAKARFVASAGLTPEQREIFFVLMGERRH